MVLAITTPALVFYTQRVDGRPFVNCLPYSLTMAMRWMGYDCPINYGMTLRIASGVAVSTGTGTGFADMRRALNVLEPQASVLGGTLADATLLSLLAPNATSGWAMAVQAYMPKLPDHLRRWVGLSFTGWHGLCLAGQKVVSGVQYVWVMDPMGKPGTGYAGEWAKWNDVKVALRKKNGLYQNLRGIYGSAV